MKWPLMFLLALPVGAADLSEFPDVTAGYYQVFAQGGEKTAGTVNGFMNEMLRLYSQYFSNWQPKAGARVVVFDNREDFREYSRTAIGLTHQGLAGYCHLKTDEAGNTFYELVAYEHPGLWAVLGHEGFHQFIGYELGAGIPTWLNEGLAQYFENSTVRNGRLVAGAINANTLTAAQALIRRKEMPALADLLAMDKKTFYAKPEVTYPASWALVHYLTTRGAIFRRYLQDLKAGQDSVASFERRFGRDNAQWQQEFGDYILRLRIPAEK
jgi:hypothetical protein